MVEPAEAVVRLVIVFLLAFGIGLERHFRRKPVGFGTFIFVSTGAAALAILAIDLEGDNPLPLLGGVITGIGFLGAGALIRANDRVFGFTTAALVWAMAALGVAAGAGPLSLRFVQLAPGRGGGLPGWGALGGGVVLAPQSGPPPTPPPLTPHDP